MHPPLYVGVDGGATKTSAVVMDSEKSIVAEAAGKPSNFQIIGIESASTNILDTLESVLVKSGANFSHVNSVCVASAGAGRQEDAERLRISFISLLEKRKVAIPKVRVESDAHAALEGAFGGKAGMILISGTGSILLAKNDDGEIHRVGGWGRYFGDEGSGFALGRSCLAAVAKEFDGRGKRTMMTQLLRERLNIHNQESLIRAVYQDRLDIASVAPIVIVAAEQGDEVAEKIITENVNELAGHVSAMIGKLNDWLPLAFAGGILSVDNFFSQKLKARMEEEFPLIEIRTPEFSPAAGAALLAFELATSGK